MLVALFIFVDDDFDLPIYADPERRDVDPDLWQAACDAVSDALDEGDETREGFVRLGETVLGYRVLCGHGLSFVAAVTDDIADRDVSSFLTQLSKRYLDEVDDPRVPDRDGVADVVVDVIPPWDE
jgi:hypothetical protein